MESETENCEIRTAFRVPECNLEKLLANIKKLEKRAVKLGLVPPTIQQEGHEDVPLIINRNSESKEWPASKGQIPDGYQAFGYRRYIKIRLIGEAPTLPGWKLVAVIEHGDKELGNVLRVAPGMACPITYRKSVSRCDHCNTARNRLETFVIINADNEYRQIGRNCLADFCRSGEAAANMCSSMEIFSSALGLCEGSEDEDFFGFGGRQIQRAPVDSVLSLTARIIRHCGWLSRSKAKIEGGCSTADIIASIFFDKNFFTPTRNDSREMVELRNAARNVEDRDVELATNAAEWIRGMRPQAEELGDYLYNLLVVTSEETVEKKHFGILCSLISSYQRQQERQLEAEREAVQSIASEHFGEVKTRGRWKATLIGVRSFDSEFGLKFMYRFLVNNSDIAVWWTINDFDIDLKESIVIVGSVKGHEVYKGVKQTQLSRCDLYRENQIGSCPNCQGMVLECDINKNCPNCKKRGLKISGDSFPAYKPTENAHDFAKA